MKMVMTVVSRDQSDRVLDRLISAGYGATFMESRGGMLRQAQKMIFVAVSAESVEGVIDVIRRTCHTKVAVSEQQVPGEGHSTPDRAMTTAEVGYAVVFVWDLEHFETF